MKNVALLCVSALLFFAGGLLLVMNGCGFNAPPSGSSSTPATQGKIQYVVIIFQENRTPDNLFQDPVLIAEGADIAGSGMDSTGATIALAPHALADHFDPDHSHKAFVSMYDGGKMDGANEVAISCGNYSNCPPPNPQFSYVPSSDVTPYFQLAEQYTFGDRMFQTNEGPSYPAHQFILSGTSAPSAGSDLFVAENTSTNNNAGCAAPAYSKVALIDAEGKETGSMYPCFEHPTLTDELNAKSVSWKYYTPTPNSIWSAPNSIRHMCGPNAATPNATACTGPDWVNNVVLYTHQSPAPILTDISRNALAAVSWVIPSGQNSDHAQINTGAGPSWVAAIVNAIGNSPYWSNTAIIITWDDWGGWYDHVPPPKVINDGRSWGSGYVYGFRVPLIVVSPYARAHYISHVNHDFGSILNFVEQVFSLPSLGYADAHANDDLSDCFDFDQSPLQFQTIPAPLDAAHFLNDRTPPTDPDDD
jgi:phospholipase C